MTILAFQTLRMGPYKPMKMPILCVSITVLDRSETNPILTGEERREIGVEESEVRHSREMKEDNLVVSKLRDLRR
jgi:hypothetical protein